MKTCTICKQSLSLENFFKDRAMKCGYRSSCKSCYKKRTDNPRSRKIRAEAVARYRKTEHGGRYQREFLKANREKYRETAKRKGRIDVYTATRKLQKQPCERCGASNVHAHHDDYSKPLEVIWLCPKHHAERHRELRDGAA